MSCNIGFSAQEQHKYTDAHLRVLKLVAVDPPAKEPASFLGSGRQQWIPRVQRLPGDRGQGCTTGRIASYLGMRSSVAHVH